MLRTEQWRSVVVFKTPRVQIRPFQSTTQLIHDWLEAIVDSLQIDPKTGGANISTPAHRLCASGERDCRKKSGARSPTAGIKNNNQPYVMP
jgi:hypothetical protein